MKNKVTHFFKPEEIKRKWYVIDAKGVRVGKLATKVATIVSGKNKPTYTPNMDTGDYCVVINASEAILSGKKSLQKYYFRHSGYWGGDKIVKFREMIQKHPDRVITYAVSGMLPKNTLGRKMAKKLKVYKNANHSYNDRELEKIEIA